MIETKPDSYIYIQSDYTSESNFENILCNENKSKATNSFERQTPELAYSGSINSSQKRFFDTNQSLPSCYNSTPERLSANLSPISGRARYNRGIFGISDGEISRERSYLLSSSRTGRFNTCNVTVPCEVETRTSDTLNPVLKNEKSSINYKNSVGINKIGGNSFADEAYEHDKKKRAKSYKYKRDIESQNIMKEEDKTDLENLYEAGRNFLLAPEFASDDRTRRFLALCREAYVAIVGCQLVYVLTSLLFGNVALAIIVSLLLIQSCFCHADGRPLAYIVNALLSLAISITVIVALAQDVSGLEPFRTDPVLKTLSYVYIPICFVFTALSVVLALGFRKLHNNEKRAIKNATNNLLGNEYFVEDKTLSVKKKL